MPGGSLYSSGRTRSERPIQRQQTGRSGCAEPLPLGASLVEVGEPERTYQPGRYMEEKEGYTCMGEDREAGQLEVESLRVDVVRVAKKIKKSDLLNNVYQNNKG